MAHGKIPWLVAFTTAPICFISFARPVSLYCEEYLTT